MARVVCRKCGHSEVVAECDCGFTGGGCPCAEQGRILCGDCNDVRVLHPKGGPCVARSGLGDMECKCQGFRPAESPPGPSDAPRGQAANDALVARVTELVGKADDMFEERWVKECFLPTLNRAGYAIVPVVVPSALSRIRGVLHRAGEDEIEHEDAIYEIDQIAAGVAEGGGLAGFGTPCQHCEATEGHAVDCPS